MQSTCLYLVGVNCDYSKCVVCPNWDLSIGPFQRCKGLPNNIHIYIYCWCKFIVVIVAEIIFLLVVAVTSCQLCTAILISHVSD